MDVPAAGPLPTYLGFVSYDIWELRIYGNRYELYNTQSGLILGTHWMFTGTAGRHNIGIRAGVNGGVWVDGAQLTLPGLILTNNTPVNAGFGTHGILGDPGLVLLENLNYIRSYNRADPEEQAPTLGTPRVTVTNFDGPRPVRVDEPIWNGSSVQTLKAVNYTEDATRADHNHGGVEGTELYLPNGRRTTGLVITPSADQVTYADGVRTVIEDPLPGVAKMTHVDAVGAVTCFDRIDPTGALQQPFNTPTTTFDYDGLYNWDMVSILFGPAEPVTTQSAMISGVASGVASASDVDVSALGCFNCDNGECACRYASPELPTTSVGRFDIYSGMLVDDNRGNGVDPNRCIMFSGPTPGISTAGSGIQVFGDGPALKEFANEDDARHAHGEDGKQKKMVRKIGCTPDGVREDWEEIGGSVPSLHDVKNEGANNGYKEETAPSRAVGDAGQGDRLLVLAGLVGLDLLTIKLSAALLATPDITFAGSLQSAGCVALGFIMWA